LQALLAERFHLLLKLETKLASGYVLTVAKGAIRWGVPPIPEGTDHQTGRWEIRADGVEMRLLARFLSVHMGGTVIDQTGLEGRYTFRLNGLL